MAAIRLALATFMLLGTTPQLDIINSSYRPAKEIETIEYEPTSLTFFEQRAIVMHMDELGRLAVQERKIQEEIAKKEEASTQKVFLTNFYPGDSTGTTAITSTGHTVDSFQDNKYGMKTYQGKVVIGAATNLCLTVKTGACAQYNSLPKGYRAYDLYDEFKIKYNNEWLDAIVLSSCGACFWNREYQTYDVMMDPAKGRIGKVQGEVK